MARVQPTAVDWVCFVLLIIGALNWGVPGLAEINVVASVMGLIFQPGVAEVVTRVIYVIVALAGLYFFYPIYRMSQRTEGRAGTASTN